ncbi:MAG: hypothetical protein AAB571_11955 [Chloroflexota bacterium]
MQTKVTISDLTSADIRVVEKADWSLLWRTLLWSLSVYLLLSWLPFVGALASGIVGGIKARRLEVALAAGVIIALGNFSVLLFLNWMSPGLFTNRWLTMTGYLIMLCIGAVIGVAVVSKRRR